MKFLSISIDDMIAFQAFRNHFDGQLQTPNIDRLIDMGVNFESAFAQVAKCNPSRTSILSGQRPEETGVHDNNLVWYEQIPVSETLPYILGEAGFETSVIGKVYHKPADNLPGGQNLPFSAYSDESLWHEAPDRFQTGVLTQPKEQHGDYINTSEAILQIDAWQPGENDAVFLGLFKPHTAWSAPQEYFDLYPLDEINIPVVDPNDLDDVPQFMRSLVISWYHENILEANFWEKMVQAYFACISFADAQVGRVLDAIEDNGALDETVIMLWSDHGYHLGDKEHWSKFTLWEESARAPLIVYSPTENSAGKTITTPVELLDIMPTALDLLGVSSTHALGGKTLRDFIETDDYPTEGVAYTTMYGSLSIRTNDYRLSLYEDDSIELYDIVSDPNEFTNLADASSVQAVRDELLSNLLSHATDNAWVRVYGVGDLSAETDDHLVVFPDGSATVYGGLGDDEYFLPRQNVTIIEQADGGTDTIYFGNDLELPGGIENATSIDRTPAKNAEVLGNEMDNRINGARTMYGLDGNDSLTISRGGFAHGGRGNDTVAGSGRPDTLLGGNGSDRLVAREGDDELHPGSGRDVVNGGGGFDTVYYRDLKSAVAIDLAAGTAESGQQLDRLLNIEGAVGTSYDDILDGNDDDNTLRGLDGDDTIFGWSGKDRLWGGSGFDVIFGNLGDDQIHGDGNADYISGRAGADSLYGGDGTDRFVFSSTSESQPEQTDRLMPQGIVAAFESPGADQGDLIDLGLIDANLEIAGNQSFIFGTTRTTGHVWLDERNGSTRVLVNTDSDGAPEMVIFINDGDVTPDDYTESDFML